MSDVVDIDQVRICVTHALQSWQRGIPNGQRVSGPVSIQWEFASADDRLMTHFTIGEIGPIENQDPEAADLFRVPVTLYMKPKQGVHVQIVQREYQATCFQDKRVLIHEFTSVPKTAE